MVGAEISGLFAASGMAMSGFAFSSSCHPQCEGGQSAKCLDDMQILNKIQNFARRIAARI